MGEIVCAAKDGRKLRIRQIRESEYGAVRALDRDAFGFNERGSDPGLHERLADNVRRSPYAIPELDLIAVGEGEKILGHAIFSRLPMGDDASHIVWLNSLAVKRDPADSHAEGIYVYQRKGIGRALVARGLDTARRMGFSGAMTCGDPRVYVERFGFSFSREMGITAEDDGCLFAMELAPEGFRNTNRTMDEGYYDFVR